MNLEVSSEMGISGYFTFEAITVDDSGVETGRRLLAGPFKNLITNIGMDKFADYNNSNDDNMLYCSVGTGTTTPAFTDTQLVSRVATTSTKATNDVSGANSSSPYIGYFTRVYQFGTGAAAGNLSEVGVGWGSDGTNLGARALIVNSSGSPTTITVLSSERLNVTYTRQIKYTTEADTSGSVTISGTSYSTVLRPANLPNSLSNTVVGVSTAFIVNNYSPFIRTYYCTGDIGPITGLPSGYVDGGTMRNATPAAYTAGSFSQQFTVTLDTGDGNDPAGIKSMVYGGNGIFQMSFTPVIPKTNTKTLTLTYTGTWARA